MSNARQGLSIVGQVVGAYFGGPIGATIGGAIGGELGGLIDGPPKGPQLEDLSAPAIEYGAKVPRVEGRVWCEVSPLWWSGLRESSYVEGGKGGDSGVETFEYHCDLLGRLCDGDNVIAWTRIEIDGVIVASRLRDSSTETIVAGINTDRYSDVDLMTGSATQSPWNVYEAAVGVANASAYRGQCTIGFTNLWMKNGRQPSRIRVEVITKGDPFGNSFGVKNLFDTLDTNGRLVSEIGPDMSLAAGTEFATDSAGTPLGYTISHSGGSVSVNGTIEQRPHGTSPLTGAQTGWYLRLRFYCNASTSGTTKIIALNSNNGSSLEIYPSYQFEASYQIVAPTASGGGALGDFYAGGNPNRTAYNGVRDLILWQYPWDANTTYINFGGADYALTNNWGADHFWDAITVGLNTDPNPATIQIYELIYNPFVLEENADDPENMTPDFTLWTPQPEDLQDVLTRMALRCEPITASDLDFSAAAGKDVDGYKYVGSAAVAMQPLLTRFYLDLFCDDKLRLVERGGASEQSIDFKWTGAGRDSRSDPFSGLIRGNDVEVPKQTAVQFINMLADGESGVVNGERESVGVEVETLTLPIYMRPSEAQAVADTATWDKRVAAQTADVSLGARHGLKMQPGSVVTIMDHKGIAYRLLLRQVVMNDWVWRCDLRLDDASILQSVGIADDNDQRAISVPLPVEASLTILDIPILRDDDNSPGLYTCATTTQGTWNGATVSRSVDDADFSSVGTLSNRGVVGTTDDALGDFDNWTWDLLNTVTVTIDSGSQTTTLSSSTRAAMEADSTINVAAIGADDRWEIIRFCTATMVGSSGQYRLSGLMRGFLGTEHNRGNHQAGDTFVLLQTTGMLRIDGTVDDAGNARYYRCIPNGRSGSSVASQSFTTDEEALTPYAPVDIRVDGSNVVWNRRSRLAYPAAATQQPRLGEETEAYDVEFYDASNTLLSTVTVTEAQTSIPVAGVRRVDVYQLSAIVGRGHAGSASWPAAIS